MRLAAPAGLLFAAVAPLLLAMHLWHHHRRRRRRTAVRFSSVALIRMAAPGRSRYRRIVPMTLFLVGVAALGLAAARPQLSRTVPIGRTTIILALDVSRSMCATDVAPNRLTVSQAAAREFVKHQPKGTRIGLVEFAGFAELVLPPTDDRTELVNAIDSMTTAPGTAIGAAVLTSIDAIAAVNPEVEPSRPIDPSNPIPQTPPGLHGYVPDIVVLLTDGANTQGVEPYLAARQASVRRLRVYTIGFGTTTPVTMVCSAKQLGADAIGSTTAPSGSSGSDLPDPAKDPAEDPQYFVIDESALHELATDTGGAYFRAQNAQQLTTVFARLPRKVELQHRQIEISGAFAAAGALLVSTAIALSSVWRRLP